MFDKNDEMAMQMFDKKDGDENSVIFHVCFLISPSTLSNQKCRCQDTDWTPGGWDVRLYRLVARVPSGCRVVQQRHQRHCTGSSRADWWNSNVCGDRNHHMGIDVKIKDTDFVPNASWNRTCSWQNGIPSTDIFDQIKSSQRLNVLSGTNTNPPTSEGALAAVQWGQISSESSSQLRAAAIKVSQRKLESK